MYILSPMKSTWNCEFLRKNFFEGLGGWGEIFIPFTPYVMTYIYRYKYTSIEVAMASEFICFIYMYMYIYIYIYIERERERERERVRENKAQGDCPKRQVEVYKGFLGP
jgi:hypothetical protein